MEYGTLEYWKKRSHLLEVILNESPCDPDITIKQIKAWNEYKKFRKDTDPVKEPEAREWTPMSVKHPEKGDRILCKASLDGSVFIGCLAHSFPLFFYSDNGNVIDFNAVVAWMKLPE